MNLERMIKPINSCGLLVTAADKMEEISVEQFGDHAVKKDVAQPGEAVQMYSNINADLSNIFILHNLLIFFSLASKNEKILTMTK